MTDPAVDTEQMYEVTLKTFISVSFDKAPTDLELKLALLDNALDYIRVVREADTDEHIVNDETSVEMRYEFIEEHPI